MKLLPLLIVAALVYSGISRGLQVVPNDQTVPDLTCPSGTQSYTRANGIKFCQAPNLSCNAANGFTADPTTNLCVCSDQTFQVYYPSTGKICQLPNNGSSCLGTGLIVNPTTNLCVCPARTILFINDIVNTPPVQSSSSFCAVTNPNCGQSYMYASPVNNTCVCLGQRVVVTTAEGQTKCLLSPVCTIANQITFLNAK